MIHQPESASEFYENIRTADKSFIQFYTPTMDKFQLIDPYVENTCKERGIHLIRANADKLQSLKNTYMIDVIPTFLLMDKEGKILDITKGAQKENVMKLVNKCK